MICWPLAALLDRSRDGIPPLSPMDPAIEPGTIDLHVHSTASDGSLAPGSRGQAGSGAPASPRSRSPITTPSRWLPEALARWRALRRSGRRRAASSRPRPPGARCTCWGTFFPPTRPRWKRFWSAAARTECAGRRQMVEQLQRAGGGALVRGRAAGIGRWSRGTAARRPRASCGTAAPSIWATRSTAAWVGAARPSSRRRCPRSGSVAELVHAGRRWSSRWRT